MKFSINNFIKNKKATTLLEILTALIILALTFIPIITTIGSSAKDTDVANSYVFAQTTARNILDTLLDDVPFGSIKKGTVDGGIGKLEDLKDSSNKVVYNISTFKSMIGATGDSSEGTITDERGVDYHIQIFVQEISDADFTFQFLPTPKFYLASDSNGVSQWFNYPISGTMTQEQAAYLNPAAPAPCDLNNYDKVTIQNKHLSEIYPDFNDSVFKKILLKISWTGKDKKDRNIVVYTMKANLDA